MERRQHLRPTSPYRARLDLILPELRCLPKFVREPVTKAIRELFDELEQQVEEASRDHLTGLHQRRYFTHLLSKFIGKCRQNRSMLGVLFVDLDEFKQINDIRGHLAGDQALRATARILENQVRSWDGDEPLCRWGGDEFLAALELIREDEVHRALHRIVGSIHDEQNQVKFGYNPEGYPIKISAGCVVFVGPWYSPLSDDDLARMLTGYADDLLMRVKRTGKHKLHIEPVNEQKLLDRRNF